MITDSLDDNQGIKDRYMYNTIFYGKSSVAPVVTDMPHNMYMYTYFFLI